jgi:hypothetical protein
MPDIDLTRFSPVTDAEAARLASPAAFAHLAGQIMATPVPATQPATSQATPDPVTGVARSPGWQPGGRPARRWTRRRALLTGLPLAALAGAAALVIGLLGPGGANDSNGANSPAAIRALSFVRENGYITVIIRNPYADTSWYNADFARHHLDITLHLIPSSPSFVGAIEAMSESNYEGHPDIAPIDKKGPCGVDGTGCTIGLKVPLGFHGQADIYIGRPARPDEQYETTGSIFNKGEALYGLRSQIIGQPVSRVWPLLASLHQTIAVCRDANNNNVDPTQVPGTDYVTDIMPWAPNEVFVVTGPTPTPSAPSPVPGQPTASPTASSH